MSKISPITFLVTAVIALMVRGVCAQDKPVAPNPLNDPSLIANENTIHPLAVKHCSACHPPPRPGAMTRKTWLSNFELMATWMREQGMPLVMNELQWLLTFYETNSPVSFTPPPDDFGDCLLPLVKTTVGDPPRSERPEVTNINVVDLNQDGQKDALICDNLRKQVSWLNYEGGTWKETVLAEVDAPVKTAAFDYEGDGDMDIVVADMGFMHPNERLIGVVHLLINRGDQTFEQHALIRGVARVADVQPGDFDGDGDTDFVVAKFGWLKTGGLIWLEQINPNQFVSHSILENNAPMRMEVLDYDGDGDQDFIVLYTQQHESLVLFTNDGRGNFSNRILAKANHPAFGSSSFQVVDLDQDGDRDLLYTNGDMMDENPEWKPYHGVRWFENVNGVFQIRELALMPGCYCARAMDMDGDGDLDVVASSLNFFWNEVDFPSLIWLENDGSQNFTRRRIAYAPSNLASIDVGDLDHDGKPDILGGGMHIPGPTERVGRLTAWLSGSGGNGTALLWNPVPPHRISMQSP